MPLSFPNAANPANVVGRTPWSARVPLDPPLANGISRIPRGGPARAPAPYRFAAVNAGQEPYLVSIGDKAEQIAEAFETRQQTTEQTLKSLLELLEQAKKARQERDATNLSPESFAVYWLLKHDGIE